MKSPSALIKAVNRPGFVASLILAAGLFAQPLFGAANDGNIEADGVWHDASDVIPRHPARGQAFAVELQTFRFDVSSVSVRLFAGGEARVVPMAWVRQKDGIYDIWRAEIEPVESDFVYYRFQIRDGAAYGTLEDFKYLINKCHKAGIAVWLDVVLNHFDEQSLPGNLGWFNGEDIYLYSSSSGVRDTGFGPRPDYGRVEVRDYLVDSFRHFIEEYHVDGFRLDHTNLIKINREGWLVLKEISQMRSRVNPRVMLTAEQWPNDSAVTRPVRWGGAGLDAQWSDIFHDNSRAALNALAFGDPSMQAIADGLNHFGYSQREMINFIESHDEARQSPQFAYEGRIVQVADQINPHGDYGLGRGKLFYGLTMFGAAVPLVLQGQEIATEIGFGDKAANKIPWEYKAAYAPYFRACREMTWLRRVSPALRSDRWQNVFHVNDAANVLAWERSHDGHHVIVIANFSNNDWGSYWIGLPQGGIWYETINTNAAKYGGQADTRTARSPRSTGLPAAWPIRSPSSCPATAWSS